MLKRILPTISKLNTKIKQKIIPNFRYFSSTNTENIQFENIAISRSSKSMYLREYEVITDKELKDRLFHCLGEILMHHDKHMYAYINDTTDW